MLIYSSSPLFSEGDITQKKDDVSKYNVGKDAAKRTYDDIVFDSVLEMRFYRDVVLPMYGSGEITNYELQKITDKENLKIIKANLFIILTTNENKKVIAPTIT